jgi:hypothetical protein
MSRLDQVLPGAVSKFAGDRWMSIDFKYRDPRLGQEGAYFLGITE